jgi:hypothetical protein
MPYYDPAAPRVRENRFFARVPDLVRLSSLDQYERPVSQLDPLALDDGLALASYHEQPLVGSAMAIVRPALGGTRSERHLGCLGMLVAEDDLEAFAESQVFVLHV